MEKLHPLLIASNFLELTWERPELLNSPIQDADLTNSYLKGYDVGFQTGKVKSKITKVRKTKTLRRKLQQESPYLKCIIKSSNNQTNGLQLQ